MGTQWALPGHSKDPWAIEGNLGTRAPQGHLSTPRELRHSGTQIVCALGHWSHSDNRRALRHSDTQGTWALGHSGTLALEVHLRIRGNWGALFSRLNVDTLNLKISKLEKRIYFLYYCFYDLDIATTIGIAGIKSMEIFF